MLETIQLPVLFIDLVQGPLYSVAMFCYNWKVSSLLRAYSGLFKCPLQWGLHAHHSVSSAPEVQIVLDSVDNGPGSGLDSEPDSDPKSET